MRSSIAIFSSRESVETLWGSINAAMKAAGPTSTIIDVVINGNERLAHRVADHLMGLQQAEGVGTLVRVWYVSLGDKAHAWNQYVQFIWPESDVTYFVDGYAALMPDALALISAGLRATPQALAASGIPTVGRSSPALRELLLRSGGMHGNFFAVRGGVLTQLRSVGFRLPLGMYRTDATLGAVIRFGLDPSRNRWDAERVLVHPHATWRFRPLCWWRPADIRSQLNRVMRQAQGALEMQAVRQHFAIEKRPAESLPITSAQMVVSWAAANPRAAKKQFLKNPLCVLALRRLRCPRDWSLAAMAPELMTEKSLNALGFADCAAKVIT